MPPVDRPATLGRYDLADPIGAGGMATIYLARQQGAVGFSRTVAIKRLHPHLAQERDFVAMFLDEARLAARVRHPNVVQTLDVVHEGQETFIVLEYVDGESLAVLVRAARDRGQRVPLPIAAAIVASVCRGLQAAHDARGPDGAPLGIVHRDVSPQNVIVGADGVARLTDFGIALANGRLYQTRGGEVKGKPAYMAPEQLASDEVTSASDIYAAGVMLWELCAGRRAYDTQNEGALYARVIAAAIPPLASVAPWVPPAITAICDRALRRHPAERFASAREMADALEASVRLAPPAEVGALVEALASAALTARRSVVAHLEATGGGRAVGPPPGSPVAHAAAGAPLAVGSASRPPPRDETNRRFTHTLTSPAQERRGRRSAVIVGAFVLAILASATLGVGGAWVVLQRSAASSARAAAALPAEAASAAGSPSATSAAAPALPVSAEARETATPAPPAEPSASSSASTSASALAANQPPRPAPLVDRIPSARGPAPSATTPTPNPCDPPYYVDANNIRRVKRECF